jgi:hypothetical protein
LVLLLLLLLLLMLVEVCGRARRQAALAAVRGGGRGRVAVQALLLARRGAQCAPQPGEGCSSVRERVCTNMDFLGPSQLPPPYFASGEGTSRCGRCCWCVAVRARLLARRGAGAGAGAARCCRLGSNWSSLNWMGSVRLLTLQGPAHRKPCMLSPFCSAATNHPSSG